MPAFAGSFLGLNLGGSLQFAIRIGMAAAVVAALCLHTDQYQMLRRLSILSAVMGSAVALFGLAQHFGSRDGLMYWSIPIDGGLGFGPFVNRNHYPFFLNLSLGLTVGLIIDRFEKFGATWPRMIAADAAFAWLAAAAGLMVASLIVCVSRGGVLSAFLSIVIVAMLRFRIHTAARSVWLAVSVAVPVILLLIWVGFDLQASRLNMLAQADRYQSDGRWFLWKAALQSVPEFLWFGSGGETYRHWETIYPVGDVAWNSADAISLRADNEFLDVLNEYGLFGLAGLLMVAGAVAVQIWRSSREDGLAAGASIGLLAVLLHSTVDFGLRVPSTGLLAVVVAALLCSRRDPTAGRRSRRRSNSASRKHSVASVAPIHGDRRLSRLMGVGLAVTLAMISIFAIRVRRRYFDAEKARWLAQGQLADFAYADALASMQNAVAATPEDVFMRTELIRTAEYVSDRARSDQERQSAIALILQHSEILRQLCPLSWRPYAWIAQYDSGLGAEGRLAWAQAARRLHPTQPDLSFLVGRFEVEQNGLQSALPPWRDSLESSLSHLDEILTLASRSVPAEEFIDDLMPDDPVVTLESAERLEGNAREQLLERTLALLRDPGQTNRNFKPGQIQELRSRALSGLGRDDEAIAAIRRAINQQPDNLTWRLRLADMCIQADRLDEATREVRIALTMNPRNRTAESLQDEISRLKAAARNVSP
ncbi:MAG: O-antigen ligase family protein [Planctomycetota bacterium]